MKVIFMGTPDFAVCILKALIREFDVAAVVTQPDRPKGRGNKLVPPPVKTVACENSIPVLQPLKIRDITDELKSFDADIFVVAAYGQILPQAVLDMPRLGCINVHASLLPKYRGSSPIQWAIINGEEITGITIIYMDKGIDTGDMILKREVPIENTDAFPSLHDKLAVAGADTLITAMQMIENGTAVREKQNDSESSYAPLIKKELGNIDWSKPSMDILNLIRGFNPWPGAYTYYNSDILKVWNAEEIIGFPQGEAGEIVDVIPKRGFVVKTGDGHLLITEIQARGGRRMDTADYLKGHKIDLIKMGN